MANVNVLVPDIQAEIPELPSFIAERQILRAARELCEEARVWRTNFSFSTIENEAVIDLEGFFGGEVELVDVISIKPTAGGPPLTAATYAWLDQNLTDWSNTTALTAQWYVLDSNNNITLVYTPSTDVTNQYVARLALKPLLTTQTLNDMLVNKFSEVLISGALARLYMIPRKPWTDMNLAQYHRTMFMASWPAAMAEATDEFQTGVPRKVKYGGL